MSAKKPPPDTIGNVRGRIAALKKSVRQSAAMAAKEGDDYDKALAKGMRAVGKELKDLRARLAEVEKTDKTPPVSTGRKPKSRATTSKPEKVPESSQEKPKKRSATRVPADYDDLLETLSGL